MRLRRNRVRVVALARMSAMGSAAKMPNTLPAVSYTHLTLPTKA